MRLTLLINSFRHRWLIGVLLAASMLPSKLEAQGFSATISELDEVLRTTCGGAVPIPDGTVVQIYWDQNLNGPDSSDQKPPVCQDPPDCVLGPDSAVNYNSFVFNGMSFVGQAGNFYTEIDFMSVNYLPNPPRFYLRVELDSAHYSSGVFELSSGVNYIEAGPWTCVPITPCSLPSKVAGVTATLGKCDRVELTWRDSDIESGYHIYRDGSLVSTSAQDVMSFADQTAPPGNYFYTVQAFNACGEAPLSDSAWGGVMPDTTRSADSLTIRYDLSAGVVRLRWYASQPGNYRVWSTGDAHNDGSPDNGSDPMWIQRVRFGNSEVGIYEWADTVGGNTYQCYVVDQNCPMILQPSVVAVDSNQLVLLSQDDSTLVFTAASGTIEIDTGQVLLGATGDGYMRRVRQVSQAGNTLTLQTEPASLTDVISWGTLEYIAPEQSGRTGPSYIDLSNTVLDIGAAFGFMASATITSGSLTLDLEPKCGLQFKGASTQCEFYLEGPISLDCNVDIAISGELPLGEATVALGPFVTLRIPAGFVQLGPIPIPVWVRLDIGAEMTLEFAAELALTNNLHLTSSGYVKTGLRVDGVLVEPIFANMLETDIEPGDWDFSRTITAKAGLNAYVQLRLLEVLGPRLSAGASGEFKVGTNPDSLVWRTLLGVDAKMSGELRVFDKRWAGIDYNLDTPSWTLAGGKFYPRSLDFGQVAVGMTAQQVIHVINLGATPQLCEIAETCDEFSIADGGGQIALGDGQERIVTVNYTPTNIGADQCDISVNLQHLLPYSVAVECSGGGVVCDPPSISVSPLSAVLHFVIDSLCGVGLAVDSPFAVVNQGSSEVIFNPTISVLYFGTSGAVFVEGETIAPGQTGFIRTRAVSSSPIQPGSYLFPKVALHAQSGAGCPMYYDIENLTIEVDAQVVPVVLTISPPNLVIDARLDTFGIQPFGSQGGSDGVGLVASWWPATGVSFSPDFRSGELPDGVGHWTMYLEYIFSESTAVPESLGVHWWIFARPGVYSLPLPPITAGYGSCNIASTHLTVTIQAHY